MILFTSHICPHREPILVREAFSWSACLFGALYLAARRTWAGAGITMAAFLLALMAGRLLHSTLPLAGLAVLQGLLCPDLLRWNLARRGYTAGPVVAAPDREAALLRLLDSRPDLLPISASA